MHRRADFSHKGKSENAETGKKRKKKAAKEEKERKRRLWEQAQRQERKQLGWQEDDEEEHDDSSEAERTVVLKQMFTDDELASDPLYKEEVEKDVTTECAKLGTIESVTIFTTNPDGVVTVRFGSAASANACVERMNGRFYAGKRVEAGLWDGKTSFEVDETPEQQEARLEQFGQELETDE